MGVFSEVLMSDEDCSERDAASRQGWSLVACPVGRLVCFRASARDAR